jgi:hypothetical protein
MSTRWQREAEKGNEAAVQYKEDLGKVTEPVKADWSRLERTALKQAIHSPFPFRTTIFEQAARLGRERTKAEKLEASTFDPMGPEAFMRGLQSISRFPLTVDSAPPRTWGEWAEKLEEHDRLGSGPLQTEQERANAARRAEWQRYLQQNSPLPLPDEEVLAQDPAWGRVVSRDHRAAPPMTLDDLARRHGVKPPVLDTVGVEAASPERAPEAAALFAGLLAEPSMQEVPVCACGKIGGGCFPVMARLDKRTKFLKMKGSYSGATYLSKDDHKLLQEHRQAAGKYAPDHGLSHVSETSLEVTDTYK